MTVGGNRGKAKITSLNHRGEGVGTVMSGPDQGIRVFVAGTVPGELVEYDVIERSKGYLRGRLSSLLEEGAGRVAPSCPVASRCGGCTWQHLSYELQLHWKKRIVEEALRRIARIDNVLVKDTVPSPLVTGYRNKVEAPVARRNGEIVTGFFEPYTHNVVPHETCLLEHPLAREGVMRLLEEVRRRNYSVYDENTGKGLIRHLIARVAPGTGEVMAAIVASAFSLKGRDGLAMSLAKGMPGIRSVILNRNRERTNVILGDENRVLYGRQYIEDVFGSDTLGYLRFRLSLHSFYQVNTPQAVRLYEIALGAAGLGTGDLVFDLYSGIGTLTLFAAKAASAAVGLEEVPAAVEDARRNAKQNRIDNVRFVQGKAERTLPSALRRFGRPATVILDPPRAGAKREALLALVRANPARIVYVSCNPATLARDLSILAGEGWTAQWVQPVDMFPQTPHVETVVLMSKVRNKCLKKA